jgi:hypothetical protein
MDPLWNSLLIAGITPPSDAPMVTLPSTLAPQDATAPTKSATPESSENKLDGSLFLGYVDLYGTTFSGPHIATYIPPTMFLMTVVMQNILPFHFYGHFMELSGMISVLSPRKRPLAWLGSVWKFYIIG